LAGGYLCTWRGGGWLRLSYALCDWLATKGRPARLFTALFVGSSSSESVAGVASADQNGITTGLIEMIAAKRNRGRGSGQAREFLKDFSGAFEYPCCKGMQALSAVADAGN